MVDQERMQAYRQLSETPPIESLMAAALGLPLSVVDEFNGEVYSARTEIVKTGEEMPRIPHWREHEIGSTILGLFLTKMTLWEYYEAPDHQKYFELASKLEVWAAHDMAMNLGPEHSLRSPEVIRWVVNADQLAEKTLERLGIPYNNRLPAPKFIPR